MHLVDNARTAWKWFSIQLAVAGAALQAGVLAFPGLKDWLGDTVTHLAGIMILVGIIAGRLVSQEKRKCEEP